MVPCRLLLRKFCICILVIGHWSLVVCVAQETPPPPPANNNEDQKIEERIENLAQTTDENTDFTEIAENLKHFAEHPINLNNTTREELSQLDLLSDLQVENLFKHIEANGNLIALEELQTIDGFDAETINSILPYVTIRESLLPNKQVLRQIFTNGDHFLLLRTQRTLETQKGYLPPAEGASPSSYYLGNPWKYYARYRFTYKKKISFGITGEKDAGEEFFHGTQSSFDFYSAHLFIRDLGPIKAIALGDYSLTYGQGLAVYTKLAFGKGAEVMNVKRNALGILPYTSVTENLFRRGAAVSIGIKKYTLDLFYSSVKFDGNVTDSTLTGDVLQISSVQLTGYHRTLSEVADKNSLGEKMFGGHLMYKNKSLNIGFTAYNSKLNAPLVRTPELYNQFDFNGTTITGTSVDYNYLWRNINFFGETARSDNGAVATLNGALIALDPRVSLTLLQRNYPRDYRAAISNPLRESDVANEKGFYSGLVLKPLNTLTLSTYVDVFSFPWLRYQVNAPSHGYEGLSQLTFTPNKKISMYFRFKQTNKEENEDGNLTAIDYLVTKTQRNFRFDVVTKISKSFSLHNRAEVVTLDKETTEPESGFLIFQDINYKPLSSPLSFNFRYALFDTKSYDTRLYAYENDVLYYYSIPAYYYKGARYYITLRYKVIKGIDVWLRFSQTVYDNQKTVGSALDEIDGNKKSEIKMQVRLEF